jgi:hypothetical protein
MIQSLRKTHRLLFVALAVLLPALFLSGIAFRHSWPASAKVQNSAAHSLPSGKTP